MVSNGRDVARTDRDGRYALPVADGSAVFVVKPAGWRVPCDGNNLPRFTDLHQPASEPERAMRICLESQFHGRNPELARDYTIQQLLGSPIAAEAAGATDLVVNVFDGGPRTTVTCRLGDRPPAAMRRVRRPDSFVEQV